NQKLEKLQKELQQAQHKQPEPANQPNVQKPFKTRKLQKTIKDIRTQQIQPTVGYKSRMQAVEAMDETIQLQNASTIFDNTNVLDLEREQRIKQILASYQKITENLDPDDINEFCQRQPITNAGLIEAAGSVQETILQIIDNQPCKEADFWIIPDTNKSKYLVLPGAAIILDHKSLDISKAHIVRQTFRGIMLIVPSEKFDLIKPGVAEKRGNNLRITSMGKLGLPLK
ncbi:hypothetical protein TI03_04335, partial [Achromatium sp. WMS1]